jgi:hypothetical protein
VPLFTQAGLNGLFVVSETTARFSGFLATEMRRVFQHHSVKEQQNLDSCISDVQSTGALLQQFGHVR